MPMAAFLIVAALGVSSGCRVYDRSSWRAYKVAGEGRQQFLHGQCTQDIVNMPAQAVFEAAVLDPLGRVKDLITVADLAEAEEFLVISSPNRGDWMLQSFEQAIFPLDRVTVRPMADVCILELWGDRASSLAATSFGVAVAAGDCHRKGSTIVLGAGTLGDQHSCVTVILPSAGAAKDALATLVAEGAEEMTAEDWEDARIEYGRPAADQDYGDDAPLNALEAGLYHLVSFSKGCFKGNEVLAKIHARDAAKQRLLGVSLDRPVPPGSELFAAATNGARKQRAGRITSMRADGRGLAVVRRKVGGAGLRVHVEADGETVAEGAIEDTPFSSWQESAGERTSPAAAAAGTGVEVDAEASAEAERKRAKLAEMESRLAAFMDQRGKQE